MNSFRDDHIRQQHITPELVSTIRLIGAFQGKEELYAKQSPEVLETLRQVAIIQSTESSNRIEGVVVAPSRFRELMAHKTRPRDRPEQEVIGYRKVLDLIHARHDHIGVTPNVILQMHRDLYQFVAGHGGRWKASDNEIVEHLADGRTRVRFRAVPAVSAPGFMQDLCTAYRQEVERGRIDALLLIPTFVLDFLCIHPFTDGNGRIARLLTLLLLYQAGFRVGRYISLERVIEETKESYYETLHASSQGWHEGKHDLTPWWNYWTGTVLASYREFADRLGKITTARGAKSELVVQAIERLPSPFRMAQIEEQCPGVSRETIRKVLNRLRARRRVKCLSRGPDAEWARVG